MNTAAELVALETAMRDLARLYERARQFTPLRARAEGDLLPRLTALGRQLRHELRSGEIGTVAIASAAKELHTLTAQWRGAIEAVRESRLVADAVAAYQRDDQSVLAVAVPQIFADLHPLLDRPLTLYWSVPAVPARRHGGDHRPVADAGEIAERIAKLRTGIVGAARGDEWWDTALPAIALYGEPAAAESPISLALDLSCSRVTVFIEGDTVPLRVYTPRLTVPFDAVLADEAGDEWWAVSAQSYEEFRGTLRGTLRQHGIMVR